MWSNVNNYIPNRIFTHELMWCCSMKNNFIWTCIKYAIVRGLNVATWKKSLKVERHYKLICRLRFLLPNLIYQLTRFPSQRAVKLNKYICRPRTKTMSWQMLKCSIELRGTTEWQFSVGHCPFGITSSTTTWLLINRQQLCTATNLEIVYTLHNMVDHS